MKSSLTCLCLLLWTGSHFAADDLSLREEAAMKAAVDHVAPSVVRIETVGGLERVGQVLFGAGPTTGLIVSADGYVVSSAFNFAQKPSSILVSLADGSRSPARLVATDHSRMLVLLKIEPAAPLPVPEAVPAADIHVGQWAIAVGRTFEEQQPNMSVGIVSAVERIWGRALQTDAKVSPSNYGGPLVDIHGRVLGVLSSLSPQDSTAVAGVEWYDSGIGFAVPLDHVLSVLPRLQTGKDLYPGILGINLQGSDQFADGPVIAACRPNSPAYEAGLKPGDTIVEIGGRKVVRQSQLKHEIGRRYAGDKVALVVLRGQERIEREVELIDKLTPYQHPFLGLLPLRGGDAGQGVPVRYVYPKSPAAKADLAAGDAIAAVGGKPVAGRDALLEAINSLPMGEKVALDVVRNGETRHVEIKPAALPEELPGELPPSRASRQPAEANRPAVGRQQVKLPEFPHECTVYVPEAYDPAVPHGIVLWLSPAGSQEGEELDQLVALWKPLCDRYDLILMAPNSSDKKKWDPGKDIPFIQKELESLRSAYTIDAARIVAHGYQTGGAMSFVLAFAARDLVRAVAAVESPLAGQPADNEPIYRLAIYLTKAKEAKNLKAVEASAKRLRDMKYPVTVKDLGDQPRYLNAEELAELARWIDTLDRI